MNNRKETEIGLIPSDWKIVRFDENLEIKNGQVQPTKEPYSEMLHIGPENMIPHSGQLVELKTNREARILSGNYHFTEDDILYSKIRPYFNKVALPLFEGTCSADIYPVRPKDNSFDKFFLFYYFLSEIFLNQVVSFQARTGIPKVNREEIGKTLLIKPSIKEQKEIAVVLSCLDRKSENLRKQNETLEAIAQTLFKHWFVDFEFPNEDGKPYKSSGGEMVRSEFGEIPAVWNVGKMEDIIEVRDGTHDSPKQTKEGFHLITSKHLKKEGIDFESAYLISESDYREVNKRSKVDTYDILLSMIGTVGILYFVSDQNINFAIKNMGLFKASKNLDYAEYIFLFLSSEYGKAYVKTRLIGTTQSYLTLSSLREMPLIIPDKAILLGFKQIAKSLFGKSHANNQQIRTLTKTRDVLLPKLMSGNLRITE